ncbi:hypothetical protein CROQUDRAFT_659511 [Cronartium quercuum f. sp. fusiforme G11]|uniref:Small-subunit processome Utp12 domain-containing protein n=1 Tax=Cronartium quercuum f. sp. fusiforme G11 TaxID=708437 RepID=A0A9P6NEZ6_9BASI|nr:hypothetical protein CROQUDRAFT_659511 [Cronartium quercuum f. sp. fusiforme G11]
MVRSYLRHGGTEVFGLIASNSSNSLFDGKRAYVPALEDVFVWDTKRGERVAMWHATGHTSPVTALSRSPIDASRFAVGYQDGSIILWSAKSHEPVANFQGHRRAISSLAWDRDGARLASGAVDGEVIIWDTAAETGQFKLRGHNNRITALVFVAAPTHTPDPSSSTTLPSASTHLLTTSQDTYLKLWDLQTQHSIESVVAHRTESWSLTVVPHIPSLPESYSENTLEENSSEPPLVDQLLITTGGEGEAKLWLLSSSILLKGPQPSPTGQGLARAILSVGSINLSTSGSHGKRVSGATAEKYSLRGGINGVVIAFQVGEREVEVWRIRTLEEVKKKRARRRKKEASKSQKVTSDVADASASDDAITWLDRICPWIVVRGTGRICSFAFAPTASSALFRSGDKPSELEILLALSNNSIEVFSIPKPISSSKSASLQPCLLHSIALPGHRTGIRALSISFNDQLVASGGNGCLKVWNLKTQKCIRTMDCGFALCVAWLPDNQHILVGTKDGKIMLYELSSSTLLTTIDAHSGAIWSLDLRPDAKGFVTGSGDKSIKFWNFTRKCTNPSSSETSAGDLKTIQLSASLSKTMKMSDDVLGVRCSPDSKFLAVATLDSTVKVFFYDTLKFFLSLYGHKLPVLAMDISFDSKLIVTCSADKNVKIWGLDFGDCHKSIFAHEESVMQVKFESRSHYFWTVGKDKMVKYWDGDKFENIQTLQGHHDEVSALAVSHDGQLLVSGSRDKSIRVWEKTDEPLFLEEEREKELERLYSLDESEKMDISISRAKKQGEEGGDEEVEAVTKQTPETLMAGEKIVEALILADSDIDLTNKFETAKRTMDPGAAAKLAPPARNPIFSAYDNISAFAYVLKVIQKLPRAALEDALLVLPFAQVAMLLTHIDHWASKGWATSLVCRMLSFVIRTHESQITATASLKLIIDSIRLNMTRTLKKQTEMVAYNAEAIRFVKQTIELEQKEKEFLNVDLKPEDDVRRSITEKHLLKKRKVVL